MRKCKKIIWCKMRVSQKIIWQSKGLQFGKWNSETAIESQNSNGSSMGLGTIQVFLCFQTFCFLSQVEWKAHIVSHLKNCSLIRKLFTDYDQCIRGLQKVCRITWSLFSRWKMGRLKKTEIFFNISETSQQILIKFSPKRLLLLIIIINKHFNLQQCQYAK